MHAGVESEASGANHGLSIQQDARENKPSEGGRKTYPGRLE